MSKLSVRFINQKDEILDRVIELADQNSSTLGHFPKGAFYQMAKRHWILVACEENELCGYILFRVVRKNNSISVTHLCVKEEKRSLGIAKVLMDHLRSTYQDRFSAIILNCRDDYQAANAFWKSYGFRSIITKRSRSKVERYLNTWKFELNGVDLFGHNEIDTDSINVVLDLNIIIDLRDRNDSEYYIESLMSDWF